jgi:hypothetical protein
MPKAAGVSNSALHSTQQRQRSCRKQWRQAWCIAATVVAAPAPNVAQPSKGSVIRLHVLQAVVHDAGSWSSTSLEHLLELFKGSQNALKFLYSPCTAGQGQRLRRPGSRGQALFVGAGPASIVAAMFLARQGLEWRWSSGVANRLTD